MNDFIDDKCAAALPGERVDIGDGNMATATNRYAAAYGLLFRLYSWCDTSICNAPDRSPKGEWLSVRAHWKDFRRNAAAC